MPCSKCNSNFLYIEDYPTCPKCESVSLIPDDHAVKILNSLREKIQNEFDHIIREFSTGSILVHVFDQREKIMRKFMKKYSPLDMEFLLVCNILLRRSIQKNSFSYTKDLDTDTVKYIIKIYTEIIRIEKQILSIQNKTHCILKTRKYDLNQLDKISPYIVKDIVENENYRRIKETLSKHNILDRRTATKKIEDWEKFFIAPTTSRLITSSVETIKTFYELISTIYVEFYRNKLHREAYVLPSIVTIDPLKLKKFISTFLLRDGMLTVSPIQKFNTAVNSFFKEQSTQFLDLFVLSKENHSSFPLFIKTNDLVLISQAFGEFYTYVLFAMVHKKEFDKETERRSKRFELDIVKDYFTKQKFDYKPNYTIKNQMEIDGIAISSSLVYVIEAKGWGSKQLIEDHSNKKLLDEEIKHAIDGVHINRKNNKRKNKVSLPYKVEWVKQNRDKIKISKNAEIKGLLVINESPTITEYKSCKVMYVNDMV